jgi:hypothetical protein
LGHASNALKDDTARPAYGFRQPVVQRPIEIDPARQNGCACLPEDNQHGFRMDQELAAGIQAARSVLSIERPSIHRDPREDTAERRGKK